MYIFPGYAPIQRINDDYPCRQAAKIYGRKIRMATDDSLLIMQMQRRIDFGADHNNMDGQEWS